MTRAWPLGLGLLLGLAALWAGLHSPVEPVDEVIAQQHRLPHHDHARHVLQLALAA